MPLLLICIGLLSKNHPYLEVRASWSPGSNFKAALILQVAELSWVWLDVGLFMHVCSAMCALQHLIQHHRGEESWKGCCGYFTLKAKCFYLNKLKVHNQTLYTQWERMFSWCLVRNSFICCSVQNSLSTDHGCWPNSPFPLTTCWHLHLWMMWGHSVLILYCQMSASSTAMYCWVDLSLLCSSLH